MDASADGWYFSTMARRIEFHRTKYGRELLIDAAFVRQMPTFLVKGPHELAFHDILVVTRGRGRFLLDGVSHRVVPGVAFFTLAELVKPKANATDVFFKSYDGYSTNNPLDVCMDDDVLVAHSWNGQPLTKEHGGPARVIIPKRYAWKGAKFVRDIQFLDRDILGFWEVRGYSNTADPWAEDRFA